MAQNGTITSAADLLVIGAKTLATITIGDLVALQNALLAVPTSSYTEATAVSAVLTLS